MADIKDEIRRIALANAAEHAGQTNPGAVLGKLMASRPELRQQAKEIRETVNEIADEVNLLSVEEQAAELEKLGGYEKPRLEERKEKPMLPPLAGAGQGKVVVRFAPNPDGAIHLGNARPAVLSHAYAKMYGGRFILRFDDTDPKVKAPEKRFYDWIKEDLAWLGIRPDETVTASERLKLYYGFAESLLKAGRAYVDTCNPEEWKKMRDESKPCPCRDTAMEDHLNRWKLMLTHKLKEGRAVYRIKTDLGHENPAVRDWAGFRIVDKPRHPLEKKAFVWPLFNFASAVDDHELGITHILRGQEHATNETKQRFLYSHMGWTYPQVIILGRLSLAGMVMSKSLIRRGIDNKEFSGWDDPRLGTLRALQRRGFQAEALRNLIIDIGPTSNDSTVAAENLAAYNRKIVDKTADRYFFVAEPVKIKVAKPPVKSAKLKLHPDKKAMRHLKVGDTLLIEKGDFQKYKGKETRLIGLYNVKLGNACEVTSIENKDIWKIHWLPPKDTVKVKLMTAEGTIEGVGEKNMTKEKVGSVVQFERFGFVRLEEIKKGSVTAVFGHK
jgi:glutamyl-tRNA synthetase